MNQKGQRLPQGKKRRERAPQRIKKRIFVFIVAVFAVLFLAAAAVGILRLLGKASLQSATKGTVPVINTTKESQEQPGQADQADENIPWQEDWVRYEGKIYEYNKDIMTFLVMGIDKEGKVQESKSATDGGQADVLFLVVADTKEKKISLVSINRDTMTDINAYEIYGENESGVAYAQIAVQHGYGDGRELSCELTKDAVSRVFFDLPINGYVAVNMDVIPVLNDAVGGVSLRAPADIATEGFEKKSGIACMPGDELFLDGKDAYHFIRWRDTSVFESARMRLERQKLYLEKFIEKAKENTKKDITFPIRLYGEISEYMVTDISVDEAAWLAGEMIDYKVDTKNIHTMEGETKMGSLHEEFYPDEKAMERLMIEVFYREVKIN